MRRVLERNIEDAVVRYAKTLGYVVRKMNGTGARAWPDRMFVGPGGVVVFIEFKRPGGQLTVLQAELQKTLQRMGHAVATFDSKDEACQFLATALGSAKVPIARREADRRGTRARTVPRPRPR